MTITDDYTVFAGRYRDGSSTALPSDAPKPVWCGKHTRFVEEVPEERGGKPHGLARGGAKWEQGTFWMKVGGNVISNVGNSSRRKTEQVGKGLSELGCNALEVGITPRGRNKRFICQCEYF